MFKLAGVKGMCFTFQSLGEKTAQESGGQKTCSLKVITVTITKLWISACSDWILSKIIPEEKKAAFIIYIKIKLKKKKIRELEKLQAELQSVCVFESHKLVIQTLLGILLSLAIISLALGQHLILQYIWRGQDISQGLLLCGS